VALNVSGTFIIIVLMIARNVKNGMLSYMHGESVGILKYFLFHVIGDKTLTCLASLKFNSYLIEMEKSRSRDVEQTQNSICTQKLGTT